MGMGEESYKVHKVIKFIKWGEIVTSLHRYFVKSGDELVSDVSFEQIYDEADGKKNS